MPKARPGVQNPFSAPNRQDLESPDTLHPSSPSTTPRPSHPLDQNVSNPPIFFGLLESMAIDMRTPHGRKTAAMRASSGYELAHQRPQIGIHAVHGAAVYTNRREHPGVVARSRSTIAFRR
jgi:hypothetical protein